MISLQLSRVCNLHWSPSAHSSRQLLVFIMILLVIIMLHSAAAMCSVHATTNLNTFDFTLRLLLLPWKYKKHYKMNLLSVLVVLTRSSSREVAAAAFAVCRPSLSLSRPASLTASKHDSDSSAHSSNGQHVNHLSFAYREFKIIYKTNTVTPSHLPPPPPSSPSWRQRRDDDNDSFEKSLAFEKPHIFCP